MVSDLVFLTAERIISTGELKHYWPLCNFEGDAVVEAPLEGQLHIDISLLHV